MHIHEAYEHDSICAGQAEEGASCPLAGCTKTGVQCVNVTAPVVLRPTAVVGTPVVTCQGSPVVTCTTDREGTSCAVTLTQEICVAIPVRYGVTMTSDDPTIACAADSICDCGCGTL